MEPVAIKLVFEDEIRRISSQEGTTFDTVKNITKKLFPKVNEPFQYKYSDEDGDVITISSEEEFQEALKVASKMNARLKLNLVEEEISSPPSCAFIQKACEWKLKKGLQCRDKKKKCGLSKCVSFGLVAFAAILFFKCLFSGKCCILLPIFALVAFFAAKRFGFIGRSGKCERRRRCQWQQADIRRDDERNQQDEKIQKDEQKEDTSVNGEPIESTNITFVQKLSQLQDMGFTNRQRNIEVLVRNNGNIIETVRDLVSN